MHAIYWRMKTWCDAHEVKLAVINNGWWSFDWLPDLLSSENIAFFDAAPRVQPVIARDLASYSIAGDGHPNAKGAAAISEAVWPFVQKFVNDSAMRPVVVARP